MLWPVTALFFLAAVSIDLTKDAAQRDVFELRGVAGSLDPEERSRRFHVSVEGKDNLSLLAGAYETGPGVIRFRPRFPLTPGLKYRVEWKPQGAAPVVRIFEIPKPALTPTAVVERIDPTTDRWPANHLRFYIHFSAPMSRGEAWRRLHLLDDSGNEVRLPFLEIEEELWDRAGKRLTVLFDPGRIKRGLVPHKEVGPALVTSRTYQLVIDRDWPDAAGTPLMREYRKTLHIAGEDRTPPVLANWRVTSPPSGTTDALVIDFPEPLDAALLERLIWVEDASGGTLKGAVTLDRNETRWRFRPDAAWRQGDYRIQVATHLEDLAGNRIGRRFDVDTFERVEMRLTTKTSAIPFRIPRAAAPESPNR